MSSGPGKAGVILSPDDAVSFDKLAFSVLDDMLYNVVYDLLLKTHRDEKMARANTAAIRVEKLAYDASEKTLPSSSSAPIASEDRPEIRVETDTAIYNSGEIYLKGNPLKTTQDILCPRCHLPRLLYPTDGTGARKYDPSKIYCKKHPYIDKPGCDIYGQVWAGRGPGRGKKKKDLDKKTDKNGEEVGTPGPEAKPGNVLSFPSATCSKCKRCILVTRLNNHMGSCIGNSGRNASRAAAQKISNGGKDIGSGNDATPPSSQKGTPGPTSRASSPRKRDYGGGGDDDGDDASDDSSIGHRKKKVKQGPGSTASVLVSPIVGTSGAAAAAAAALTKKAFVKGKGGTKKDKVKVGTPLSVEQKVDDVDDAGTVQVATKKSALPLSGMKAGGASSASPVKKLKAGPGRPPLSSPLHKRRDVEKSESDSSGTLSSPPR